MLFLCSNALHLKDIWETLRTNCVHYCRHQVSTDLVYLFLQRLPHVNDPYSSRATKCSTPSRRTCRSRCGLSIRWTTPSWPRSATCWPIALTRSEWWPTTVSETVPCPRPSTWRPSREVSEGTFTCPFVMTLGDNLPVIGGKSRRMTELLSTGI